MRSLYLRIWLTVVASLAMFALVSGWLVQRHLDEERQRFDASVRERVEVWAELIQRSLPDASSPVEVQAEVLRDLGRRLRMPLALDDSQGKRIAALESFQRRETEAGSKGRLLIPIRLDDGRTLWVLRPARMHDRRPPGPNPEDRIPRLPNGLALVVLLGLLFAAVAMGAWPVVRRLTRRLEALKQGVDAFGAGALHQRVAVEGRDEVAALAGSFNRSAARIEALVRSHQSLLANASHELRSPLARLKMALGLLDNAGPTQREKLQREVDANIAELDALVEEVLMASRLDASTDRGALESVDLLALLAEEAARVQGDVEGDAVTIQGEERLLRRALRNLLENARRYGGGEISAQVQRRPDGALVRVCDRGPGVPEVHRSRIFEAFFRLPGHAEREGGVGLGLSLVRQIAERHGGSVRCLAREGGGSCFEISLPLR